MAVEESAVESVQAKGRIQTALEAVLPYARIADGLARRMVGKVGTIAMLGFVAAGWLATACALTFDWGLVTALILFFFLVAPAAVLWKIHSVLKNTVGLPQRVVDTANRAYEKSNELRQAHVARPSLAATDTSSRSRFKDLWKAARSVLEIKSLSDEARELVAALGSSIAIANPAFAFALFIAMGISLLLTLIASLVALAFIL